ncbi:diguanylate cyclase [Caldimonas tepidiphila]|uniref:diguanylate cyclase n=1 Tax=Caldimonas tepidiphila TaxID=2315841 RepID=UPI000E5B91C8|nr:diguanylate cyclase [Caldimonas tepidiphila]
MSSRWFLVAVLSRLLALAAFLLGAAVLFGWVVDHRGLKAPLESFPAMKANTALALVLAGAMCVATGPALRARRLGQASALLLLLVALPQAVQGLWEVDLGVDQLLFRDDTGFGPPGRMPLATAYGFIALACARLLLDGPSREMRLCGVALSVASVLAASAIGIAYVDWVFSRDGLPILFSMAPHTALGTLLIAWALVAAYVRRALDELVSPSRLVVLGCAALAAVLACANWGYVTWRDYTDTRGEATAWSRNLVRVLNEHVRRSLDTPAFVLAHLESEIAERKLLPVARSREGWEALRAIASQSPQIGGIALLDREGELLLLSTRFPSPGGNFAFREYFQAHAAGAPLHIGPMILSPAAPGPVFTYSRRLEDEQGRFAGVLMAVMAVDYYRAFFESLDLPPGSVVGLLTTGGRYLVREPMNEAALSLDLSRHPLFVRYSQGQPRGTFVAPSPVDGRNRLVSFEREDGLGFIVMASLDMHEVTAAFERRTVGTVTILMLVLAMLGGGALLQLRAIEREEAQQAFVAGVLDSIVHHIAILDRQGRIVRTNRAWSGHAVRNGAREDAFLGENYLAVCRSVSGPDAAEAAAVAAGIEAVMAGTQPEFVHPYRCDGPGGGRWFNLRVTPLAGGEGAVVVSHEDITAMKQAEEAVRRLAQTDPLTGLANRRAFSERAERECARAGRHDTPLSVISLDLDHFKRVNDTHGHDAGDKVLVAFAGILQAACRVGDLVARFGGEEFVILLPDTGLAGARLLAERIRREVAQAAVRCGDAMVHITVSGGVAQHAPGRETLHELLARSDAALYAAKEGGRNRILESAPLAVGLAAPGGPDAPAAAGGAMQAAA